ncbi:hypothetical protein [Amycolatopsis sp. cmx-8-4]|uniref:hypothetical protein n=1 Tax=Amycolatopsis sp. cmx-8-4 TaxID=2790947 RepID=UPI00397D77E1
MDAATAGLIGAAIGMSGTVVTPLVNNWLSRREKRREIRKTTYSEAFRLLGRLLMSEDFEERKDLAMQILTQVSEIQVVGSNETSQAFFRLAQIANRVLLNNSKLPDSYGSALSDFIGAVQRDLGMASKKKRLRFKL